MKHAVNWFEIPVTNFERGIKFYKSILECEISVMPHPTLMYGMLPYDMTGDGVGGALVQGEGYKPSPDGIMVYLNGGDDLSSPLSRVEKAGGRIVLEKTSLGPNGFMAIFIDTEGNRVALHSKN